MTGCDDPPRCDGGGVIYTNPGAPDPQTVVEHECPGCPRCAPAKGQERRP